MTKIISTIMTLGLVVTALVLNQGCGSTKQAEISTKHDGTYIGSGSVWTWNLTATGTFTATKKATMSSTSNDLEIAGTYVTNSTGFYTFTVGTATGVGAPATGTQANGFGVPGVVLMVKPTGGGELLVMPVKSTACPTGTTTFNWVQAKPGGGGGNLDEKDLWGNASFGATAGPITGVKWRVNGSVEASSTLTTHTGCSNGLFTLADGFINMTSAGVGIVKTSNGDGGSDIIALPRDTSVTKATVRSKNFVGLVFSSTGGTNGEVKPMNISFGSGDTATYSMLSNVETGATGDTGTITIAAEGAGEQAGFLKFTASGGDSTKTPTMWAAVVPDIGSSGRTFFFASGTNIPNAGGHATEPFAVIAIQK